MGCCRTHIQVVHHSCKTILWNSNASHLKTEANENWENKDQHHKEHNPKFILRQHSGLPCVQTWHKKACLQQPGSRPCCCKDKRWSAPARWVHELAEGAGAEVGGNGGRKGTSGWESQGRARHRKGVGLAWATCLNLTTPSQSAQWYTGLLGSAVFTVLSSPSRLDTLYNSNWVVILFLPWEIKIR